MNDNPPSPPNPTNPTGPFGPVPFPGQAPFPGQPAWPNQPAGPVQAQGWSPAPGQTPWPGAPPQGKQKAIKSPYKRERIGIVSTFSLTFQVFGQRLLTLWGLNLPAAIPAFFFFVCLRLLSTSTEAILTIPTFLLSLASVILPVGLQSGVAIYLYGALKSEPPSFWVALTGGLERCLTVMLLYFVILLMGGIIGAFISTIIMTLFMLLPSGIGMLVVFVGSCLILILISKFCVIMAASGVEKLQALASMNRAWSLSVGNLPMAFTATLAAAAVSVGTAYLFVKALVVADNNLFVFLPLIILATFVLSFIGTLFAVTYCRFRIVEESHKIKDDSQAFDQYQY